MMKKYKMTRLTLALLLSSTEVSAAPFGDADDVAYAGKLWKNLTERGLVGTNAIMSTPYTGVHPHGVILDTIDAKAEVGKEENVVILKRNYGGEGVSKSAVANDPAKYPKAVTVMFKRSGYDLRE